MTSTTHPTPGRLTSLEPADQHFTTNATTTSMTMESTNKNTQSHHDTRATNGHPFTGRDALAQSIYTQRQSAAPQPLRALRRREVINKTGLSRTTLHLLEIAGKFPKHRLLTPRCAVWIESEVDQWLLDRLASPAAPAHLPNVALRRSTPGRGKRL